MMSLVAVVILSLLVAAHAGLPLHDPNTDTWYAPSDGSPVPINFVGAGGIDKTNSAMWLTEKYIRAEFTAKVGDTLRFDYGITHDVYLLPTRKKYDDCDFTGATILGNGGQGNGPGSDQRDGNDFNQVLFKLDLPYYTYFSCSSRRQGGTHCAAGQKIRINVDSATDGTCNDGIKNRHADGRSEQGVDCGGPCYNEVTKVGLQCNSCYDDEQKDAEEGVDCGMAACNVPCPVVCPDFAIPKFASCKAHTTSVDCRKDTDEGCSWCEGDQAVQGCYYGQRCLNPTIQNYDENNAAKCHAAGGKLDNAGAVKWCGYKDCPTDVMTEGHNPNGVLPQDAAYPAAVSDASDVMMELLIVVGVLGLIVGIVYAANYYMNGSASVKAKERFDLGSSPVKV